MIHLSPASSRRKSPAEEGRRVRTQDSETSGPRAVIAHRAAQELYENAVINFGFGIPDGVAKLVAARGETDRYYQTIEHGTYGGELLDGVLFGFARNASCMIDSPSQFDLYSGGRPGHRFSWLRRDGQFRECQCLAIGRDYCWAGRIYGHRSKCEKGCVLWHTRGQGRRI